MSHEGKEFRLALKWFLLMSSFFTLDEYFNWKLLKNSVPCKVIKFYDSFY